MSLPMTLSDLGLWLGLNSILLFLTSFGMLFVKKTFMIKVSDIRKAGLIVILAFVLVSVIHSYDLLMEMLRGTQNWFMQRY